MSCWSEGELRAWIDRELAAEEMERIATHLAECPRCDGVYRELSGRAARVGAMLEAIAEPEPAVRDAAISCPSVKTRKRWPGVAAAALAAGFVIGFLLMPRRTAPPAPVPQPRPEIAATVPVLPAEAAPPAVRRAAVPPAPRRRQPVSAPRIDYYLALDDDPIEAGVVMRIGLADGHSEADVIFSPEGRARAIRLVK